MKIAAVRHLHSSGEARATRFLGITGFLTWCGSAILRAQQIPLPKLRPPHEEIGPSFWEQHHWQIISGGLALLIAIVLVILWFRRPKPVIVTPPEIRARNSLACLRGQPENTALVVEVSRIVRDYLVSVFMLPPDELTTSELSRALKSRSQIDDGATNAINAFLKQCDEWKFAPAKMPGQTGVVGRASDIVEMVEKQRHQPQQGTTAQRPFSAQTSS